MKVCLIIGLLFLILGFYLESNDYNSYKNRNCVVLDKLTAPGRYSVTFYLILKETETGSVFDKAVSPAMYSQSQVNQNVVVSLPDYGIKFNRNKYLVFFILPMLLFFVSSILIFVSVVSFFLK